MNNQMVILVSSCDEYSDIWDSFILLFKKYWPNCPFPVFLSSLTKNIESPGIQNIKIGHREGWGDGLSKALTNIKSATQAKYLLLLLDDYFLNDYVDNEKISACLNAIIALNGNYLRLIPKPAPNLPIPNFNFLGMIPKGVPYRVSLQASIWQIDTLADLLSPRDTPWDMEINGSARSNKYDGFFCTNIDEISYINGIVRGRWTTEAIQSFNENGMNVDTSFRLINDSRYLMRTSFHKIKEYIVHFIPVKIRFQLRRIFMLLSKRHNK